jgi:hypothetical protein
MAIPFDRIWNWCSYIYLNELLFIQRTTYCKNISLFGIECFDNTDSNTLEMIINILPDELEPEFRESWKMGFITQPSIDYADNAIWAIFEGRQVTIFRFKEYGFINDNRYNNYFISTGVAGITIRIEKSKTI